MEGRGARGEAAQAARAACSSAAWRARIASSHSADSATPVPQYKNPPKFSFGKASRFDYY